MTDERILATSPARAIIRAAERRAFAWGFLPIPLVDVAAVTYTQLRMIDELAAHYGVPYSDERARPLLTALLGALLPTYFGTNLAYSLLRTAGVGRVLALVSLPSSLGGATRVVGKLFAEHFHAGGTLENFSLGAPQGPGRETPTTPTPTPTPSTSPATSPETSIAAPSPSKREASDEPSAGCSTVAITARLDRLEQRLARELERARPVVPDPDATRRDTPITPAEATASARAVAQEVDLGARVDATLGALRAELRRVATEAPAPETAASRQDVAALAEQLARVQRTLDAALASAAGQPSASDTQLQRLGRCMTDREVLVDILDDAVEQLRASLARASQDG